MHSGRGEGVVSAILPPGVAIGRTSLRTGSPSIAAAVEHRKRQVRCLLVARGGGRQQPDTLRWQAQVDARRRVGKALDALGGLGSPAGSCVWHVVGLQRSIREWAMRQGWGGRPVRVEQAQGILVAALGVLAGWYRYVRGR